MVYVCTQTGITFSGVSYCCHLWYLAQFPPCLLVCLHGGATQMRSNLVDQFVSMEFKLWWWKEGIFRMSGIPNRDWPHMWGSPSEEKLYNWP